MLYACGRLKRYLQRNGVICHEDIKPGNTGYCSKTNNIKIIDIDGIILKPRKYKLGVHTRGYVK